MVPPGSVRVPRKRQATTVAQHLEELGNRLTIAMAVVFGFSCLGYFFRDYLTAFLQHPLGRTLYYTSPIGGFQFIFGLSVGFGVVLSLPVLLYQLAAFVSPALPEKVKPALPRVIILSLLFVIAGVLFGYYLCLPATLRFLMSFDSDAIQPLLSTDQYFSFLTIYLVGFAVIFQLPILMHLINMVKPLNPRSLLKFERWVVLISFIVAAIVTPTPDPVNQTIVALPLIVLYQLSIVGVWVSWRRRGGNKQVRASLTPDAAPPPKSPPPKSPPPAPPPPGRISRSNQVSRGMDSIQLVKRDRRKVN